MIQAIEINHHHSFYSSILVSHLHMGSRPITVSTVTYNEKKLTP